MNIGFKLAVFGFTLGTFDVRIDIDKAAASAINPVVDGYVKRVSRRWVRHMAS
jgi:hypothetical protein